MFTPKEIECAFIRLFNLFDPIILAKQIEDLEEEIDDISTVVLAAQFNEFAETIYDYHEEHTERSVDPLLVCLGIDLFNCRAVRLLFNRNKSVEDEQAGMYYTELWLLEDMTFAVVHNLMTVDYDDHGIICITNDRTFVKSIEHEDDIFFLPEDLVYELDDICMLAQLDRETDLFPTYMM